MSDNDLYVPFIESDDEADTPRATIIYQGKPSLLAANLFHTLAGVRWKISTQSITADWGCLAKGMTFFF